MMAGQLEQTAAAGADHWFTKWWILLIYSYTSGLQSLLWMTWSSVPDQSKAYLGVDDSTLDLWLNYGPIAYCISTFLAAWVLLARPDGIRVSVLLGTGLCLAASLVRSVPALLDDAQRDEYRPLVLACVHVGQFLNAAVAPLVVASPSYLSLVWFPEDRRNLATAIGNVANAVGRGVGFFLGPALVSSAGDLPHLLVLEIALAALPFVGAAVYYPSLPSQAPSAAAAEEMAKLAALTQGSGGSSEEGSEEEEESEAGRHLDDARSSRLLPGAHKGSEARRRRGSASSTFAASLASAVRDFRECLRSPGLVLLTVSGGLQMAVYGAWSGTLPSVLSPRFSNGQAGTLGSVNTFVGVLGGLAAGLATDHPALRRSLKTAVLGLVLASAAVFGLLAAALGPTSVPSVSGSLGFGSLVALCALAGLLRGGADPLFFELSAELVHPTPAGTAGGVLTFIYHVILVLCLSVPPGAMAWSMVAMAGALVVSAGLLAGVTVHYVRR